MMDLRRSTLVGTVLVALVACDEPTGMQETVQYTFDFDADTQGWTADFVDYPVDDEDDLNLVAEHRPLPEPLDTRRHGFFLSGRNESDDLFMYMVRRVDGLRPGTPYRIRFLVEFATNAPSGCAGAGGAPGESVAVKAGAATEEPVRVVEDGYYRLNIDKGNQSSEGENAIVLGDIAGSSTDCFDAPYEIKTLQSDADGLSMTTDADGGLWLFVGTESGFESTTSLYYTRVEIAADPR